MKHSHILSALILSAIAFFTINANASASLIKTLDGAAAYCPKTGFENPIAHEKNVKIESIQESDSSLILRVSLVKCDDGQWNIDANPKAEKFSVVLDGKNPISVEKDYANYQLLLLTKDSEIVAIKNLQNLENKGIDAVSINLDKMTQNQYEVVLRVKNSMKASNGAVEETHYSTFGSFNLNLK